MLPSPLTILTVVVATFFVTLTMVRGPVDADFWWHLTTGRLILDSGAVPSVDPFSFAYDGPWVAHEWLGEVVIQALVSAMGYPATAALFGLAATGALMLPALALQHSGVRLRSMLPFVAIGTYTYASFVTVRPQALSWLLLGLLIAVLIRARRQHRATQWLIPPMFLLWANLHGLWVVGLGVLAIHAVSTLLERRAPAPGRLDAIGVLLASAAAAAVTPGGIDGLLYPLRYLRQDDWGTAFIAEWQPADVSDPRQWGFLLLIAAAVGVTLGLRAVPGWQVVVGVIGLIAGVVAVRNQPLAVIMTMPMLANVVDARLGHRRRSPEGRQRRILEMGLGAVVIAAVLAIVPATASGSVRNAYPVDTFDRLVEADPSARAFVDYDWGGYAIHRLHATGGSVFIDGRSDMYPREIFEDYLALRGAEDGWQGLLDRYRVEAILLPPDAPLVPAARTAGWCEAGAADRAVLLLPCR